MEKINTLHQHAVDCINRGEFIAAHPLCVQIVSLDPNHADAYFLLGIINSEIGQFRKAIALIQKAISVDAKIEYYAYLAKCFSLTGDMTGALAAIKHTKLQDIHQPSVLDTVGVALSRIGLHKQAITFFQKALETASDNPQYLYNHAVSCKFDGRFDEAEIGFESAIRHKFDFYAAHFALSDLSRPDPNATRLQRLRNLQAQTNELDGSLHLAHALAKEYEARKEFTAAFTALTKAKKDKRQAIQYDFAQDDALFNYIKTLSSKTYSQNAGCQSTRPIFVIGMPRSGTTLVERIISSHSDVASGGELQDFGVAVKELTKTPSNQVLDLATLKAGIELDAQQLGQLYINKTRIVGEGSPRFVDKLPFNFFYLTLIRKALPNAKVVCLLRNPMDTCLGNFRQLFSINSPHYAYAYDLLDIGRFYVRFYELAQLWNKQNDDNFLLLDYQKLVTHPDQVIRALIDFCGLSWQEACLYVEKNQAPVSTASKVQVREPINVKAIGRWKNYEKQAASLADLMSTHNIPF